jgi:hypothetical protein
MHGLLTRQKLSGIPPSLETEEEQLLAGKELGPFSFTAA